MRFYFFTKTYWDEPPRIRHQLAELLGTRGNEVVFFETPRFLLRPPAPPSRNPVPANVRLVRTTQLIHHQLRVLPPFAEANAVVERRALRAVVREVGSPDVIINFCYDYFFLREVFGQVPLIALMNDDFIAGARWFAKPAAERALAATISSSDHSLTVSHPILRQLRRYTDLADLFLPWARRRYQPPDPNLSERESLLYWGFINERIDLASVRALLDRGVRIEFVGPISDLPAARAIVEHQNARYHGVLSNTELAPIAARCLAAILPYDASHPMVQAVTISNRAFDLLSFGLPLLYVDLPGLLEAPPDVIHRCRTVEDYVRALNGVRATFNQAQVGIRALLDQHTPDARYEQLMNVIRTVMDGRSHP